MYLSTLKIKLEDPALIAVANNNVVCINKDQNIFDSKKKIKNATNEQLVHKLPSILRKYIALNSAIFAMYANQTEQCNKLCKSVEQTWPELTIHARTLQGYNLAKAGKLQDALALLQNSDKTEDVLYYKLCCAHLYLMQVNAYVSVLICIYMLLYY